MKLITLPNSRTLTTSIRATALVFEDPVSRSLLDRVEMVAPSEANVLIIGETGTGKELIARQVHGLSGRSKGPFVPVNCGALSDTLAESELFGHEKGAFTGASSQKIGWFEAAHGGTLFLDEIGDLSLPIQVKLLRVLQEREVFRLGSRRPIPIDVRIIAATNVRLEQAVAAGRFREDLLYRLRVVSLDLHPLRKRAGDILPIAQHFVQDYADRLGCGAVEISAGARRKLLQHPWPGNIRELENVIHHALLVCKHQRIEADDLTLSLPPSRLSLSQTSALSGNAPDHPMAALEAALLEVFESSQANLYEEIEDTVIRTAYGYCQKNQLQTARLLGISRNIVRARLLRMGALGGATPRKGTSGSPLGTEGAELPADQGTPGRKPLPLSPLPPLSVIFREPPRTEPGGTKVRRRGEEAVTTGEAVPGAEVAAPGMAALMHGFQA